MTDDRRHVADEEHCGHWQEGDGDCCGCGQPNWCPDEGEDFAVRIPKLPPTGDHRARLAAESTEVS